MTPCTTSTRAHAPVVEFCPPSWGLRSPTPVLCLPPPHQSLHLFVQHAIQRLKKRSQPARDEDGGGVCPPPEVLDEGFATVAPEVVQHQDAVPLLDDAPVVRPKPPAFGQPQGTLPRVTPAFLLHAERHAGHRVPELGAVGRKDLGRNGALAGLSVFSPPRPC